MRSLGGAFALCEDILHRNGQERLSQVDQAMLLKALASYQQQNMPCSFLDGGECSIYEVRPYVCANHYVTTPEAWCQAENWCNPDFPNRPRIYMTELEEIDDRSFYLGNLSRPVISFFQTTVYRILTGGMPYVAEMAGFETLTAGAS